MPAPLAGSSMVDPTPALRACLDAAIRKVLGADAPPADALIHRSAHADFQADAALALARQLKKNPRELAVEIAAALDLGDVIGAATVSGPGFINLQLRDDFLAARLGEMLADDRLGAARAATPETVVIDYSSPNVAKEMHVGHLRSTVIGDALARLLEFQGHRVIRQNHVGDWGTPFGMLIEHLLDSHAGAAAADSAIGELAAFYRAARAKFDADPAFAERARLRVVALQGGDPVTLAQWRRLIDASVAYFSTIYQRLGITLRPEDIAGESQYNAALPGLVAELEAHGVARVSDGAVCVFPPGFTGREGEPVPLIIRKQDGGYGYGTTDLAALRHRVGVLHAQRIIIVVGAPQSQHLALVFAAARMAGWVPDGVRLEHVAFGSVLGADKKMFKTRSGDTIALAALLDEAIEKAGQAVADKAPEINAEARGRIADAVGIGAIKYADLASDRIKDYVFDFGRMLAFEGNTAPYLMYAHARIRSILRKAREAGGDDASATIQVGAPAERALALTLLDFPVIIDKTGEALQPHRLCGHLYAVAAAFTAFYENCPVLKAETPALRASRLRLCDLTARVLACGLALLGIAAPEQM